MFRLCVSCQQSFERILSWHRLIPKREAQRSIIAQKKREKEKATKACSEGGLTLCASATCRRYVLRETDIATLPRAVDANPIAFSFNPMSLYRKLDVRRAAIQRHGSFTAVCAAHRRNLIRQ